MVVVIVVLRAENISKTGFYVYTRTRETPLLKPAFIGSKNYFDTLSHKYLFGD